MEKLTSLLAGMLLPEGRGVLSITGAGGKTSAMMALGRHFRDCGKSVLLTTTTKIRSARLLDYGVDDVISSEPDALLYEPVPGRSALYAEQALMDPKKMVSPRLEVLSLLLPRFDVVIIEADGSKGLPLKMHTSRDPVILEGTDAVLAIIGATAFGDMADNVCFGYEGREMVDEAFVSALTASPEGALKGRVGRTVLLINQADEVQPDISRIECPVPLVLGSLREDRVYGCHLR